MNQEIYNKALYLLAMREHSRYELQLKLLRRNYERQEIIIVLDRLLEEKFQSDERFAEIYIHSRASKGYGPERIKLELQHKGVKESVVHFAMQNAGVDWSTLAQQVYNKKFGAGQSSDFQERIKRQQFMRYRGF